MDIINGLPYIINLLELVAAIMASVHFLKYKNTKEHYFLYFLWFTVFVEIIGAAWGYVFSSSNLWLYNVYMLVSFMFYFSWYYSLLSLKSSKKVILVFALVYAAAAIWGYIYQSWDEYHKYTFVIGAFFTMICTVFHFRKILFSSEVLILKHKLNFWISTGLLLFNMGMIPLMLLSDYFNFASNRYFGIVMLCLNIILYGCYIIGFQWAKEKYNRF